MSEDADAIIGVDPRLCGRLLAAQQVATECVHLSASLVSSARIDGLESGFQSYFELLVAVGRRKRAVDLVLADVIPVSIREERFGSSCAHVAALDMRDRVLRYARVLTESKTSARLEFRGASNFQMFRSVVRHRELLRRELAAEHPDATPRDLDRHMRKMGPGLLDDLPATKAIISAIEGEAYRALQAVKLAAIGQDRSTEKVELSCPLPGSPAGGNRRKSPRVFQSVAADWYEFKASLRPKQKPMDELFRGWLLSNGKHYPSNLLERFHAWRNKVSPNRGGR